MVVNECLQKSLADVDTLLSAAIFKLDNNDVVCVKPLLLRALQKLHATKGQANFNIDEAMKDHKEMIKKLTNVTSQFNFVQQKLSCKSEELKKFEDSYFSEMDDNDCNISFIPGKNAQQPATSTPVKNNAVIIKCALNTGSQLKEMASVNNKSGIVLSSNTKCQSLDMTKKLIDMSQTKCAGESSTSNATSAFVDLSITNESPMSMIPRRSWTFTFVELMVKVTGA